MKFENWTIEDLFARCMDYDDMTLEMDKEEFAALRRKIAMLQAGNSPVIPDGYVMVPKEPTEDMIVEGFESWPDEDFSEPEIWEEYQNMSGCQQAAHRARLCWAAMLAVAPPAPNSTVK